MAGEALARLVSARTQLLIVEPFFGQLAMRLDFVESPGTKRLAVDGRSIFYNAEFVLSMPSPQVKSAIAHEVLHCAMQHIDRLGSRRPYRWNVACDYVVNDLLALSRFELGDDWFHDVQYRGMSADEIYAKLPEEKDEPSGSPCVMQAPPDDRETSMEWAVAAVQAATAAAGAGKLPGPLKAFVAKLLKPPAVDWRTMLQQFVRAAAADDYSWLRPNKRYISFGFYLPSLYSEKIDTLVVAIDVSGSIGTATQEMFLAEIDSIRMSVRPRRTLLIYCDTEVKRVDEFGPDEDIELMVFHGGGTSFIPPFTWLEENNISPDCLLYLTDLIGGFPEPPQYPVLWGAINDRKAPFGTTVRLPKI